MHEIKTNDRGWEGGKNPVEVYDVKKDPARKMTCGGEGEIKLN